MTWCQVGDKPLSQPMKFSDAYMCHSANSTQLTHTHHSLIHTQQLTQTLTHSLTQTCTHPNTLTHSNAHSHTHSINQSIMRVRFRTSFACSRSCLYYLLFVLSCDIGPCYNNPWLWCWSIMWRFTYTLLMLFSSIMMICHEVPLQLSLSRWTSKPNSSHKHAEARPCMFINASVNQSRLIFISTSIWGYPAKRALSAIRKHGG